MEGRGWRWARTVVVIVFDVVLDKIEFRNSCVVRGRGREGSFKCMLTQGPYGVGVCWEFIMASLIKPQPLSERRDRSLSRGEIASWMDTCYVEIHNTDGYCHGTFGLVTPSSIHSCIHLFWHYPRSNAKYSQGTVRCRRLQRLKRHN